MRSFPPTWFKSDPLAPHTEWRPLRFARLANQFNIIVGCVGLGARGFQLLRLRVVVEAHGISSWGRKVLTRCSPLATLLGLSGPASPSALLWSMDGLCTWLSCRRNWSLKSAERTGHKVPSSKPKDGSMPEYFVPQTAHDSARFCILHAAYVLEMHFLSSAHDLSTRSACRI